MSRFLIALILIVVIVGAVLVFVFDLLGFQSERVSTIAKIINYEDTRRVSDSFKELFANPDPEIRRRSALAIGRIGGREYIDQLFELLSDDSSDVAETAAFAIGLCGDSSDASKLLDMSKHFNPDLEAVAVQSIGHLIDSTSPELCQNLALKLDHTDHRVREQTAYAIFQCGFKEAWPKLAQLAAKDPVRTVQVASLFALTRMRIEDPKDLYMEWHSDSDPYVRSLAYRGLALGKNKKYISTIASGLNDRDARVVSQAISSLASYRETKATEFLASRYADEIDQKLKVQLLNSFTRLDDDQIIEQVIYDIHKSDVPINLLAAAVSYIATIKKDTAIALIDSLSTHESFYLRSQLVDALKSIGGKNVQPRLMSFFKDSSAAVRGGAFDALTTVDSGNVEFYLNTALADSNYLVNAYAIFKIGELKRTNYLPQLMTMFESSEKMAAIKGKITYDDIEIKRAIVETVGKLLPGKGAKPDSLAEEILFRCLHDNDYITSLKASEIYQDKLDVDKSSYISHPRQLVSVRDMKSALATYLDNPYAVIYTERGKVTMELYFDVAPLTVLNFIRLAESGFYDNLIFHRVVPNFVVQGGDPLGTGWGGPGYSIRAENNPTSYIRGAVGMADAGLNTGGSQFFITHSPQPHLDIRYTLFGQVINGMDIVDQMVRGDTIRTITIRETIDNNQ